MPASAAEAAGQAREGTLSMAMAVLPVQAARVKAPAMPDKARVCRAREVETVQGVKVREMPAREVSRVREMQVREMSRVRAEGAGVVVAV